jgi:putative FmdB family regulatory protein
VPTYEYECERCQRVTEVRQRISEPPLTACDACGGPVRRLLSPAAFILKGAGWYVTDYPSESRKKALAAEKSSGAPGASDGKSEKSDARAETKSSTPTPSTPTSPSSGSSASSS